MREYHAHGQPHSAVRLALSKICERGFKNLAYDLIKARGTPTPDGERRAQVGFESAAASGELTEDQLALMFEDGATLADELPSRQGGCGAALGRFVATIGAKLRGATSASPTGAASEVPAGAAPTGRARVSREVVLGRATGDDAATLEMLLRYIFNLGAGRHVLCKIEALAGAGTTVFVDVFWPSSDDLLAPWARRELSGLLGRAALARETALVMAAAPAEMLYWPPRPKDFFFWSWTVQKPTVRTASLLGVVRLKLRE